MPSFRKIVTDLVIDNNYKHLAEVGVWEGVLSKSLLDTNPKTLILVDPLKVEWNHFENYSCTTGGEPVTQEDLDDIADKLNQLKATFIRKPSHEAVKKVADKSLDFVFIDAVHLYDYVYQDINLWLPKIKKGGMIAGDDVGGKHGREVKPAVLKFFPNYNKIGKVWYQQL